MAEFDKESTNTAKTDKILAEREKEKVKKGRKGSKEKEDDE